MGRLGYRKREPNEPPREYPKRLRQIIAVHMKKLGSAADVARLLHLKVTEFQRMYGNEPDGDQPRLRLVK